MSSGLAAALGMAFHYLCGVVVGFILASAARKDASDQTRPKPAHFDDGVTGD